MKKPMLIAIGAALGLLFVTAVVYAAEVVASPDNPAVTLEALYNAVKGGAWMPAFGLGLILVTWAARSFLGKLSPWFATKLGGYLVAGLTALTATVGGSLAAGEGFSVGLLTTALSVAWVAAGGFEMVKDLAAWLSGKLK